MVFLIHHGTLRFVSSPFSWPHYQGFCKQCRFNRGWVVAAKGFGLQSQIGAGRKPFRCHLVSPEYLIRIGSNLLLPWSFEFLHFIWDLSLIFRKAQSFLGRFFLTMNVCQMDVVKKVFSSFFRVAQSWNGNWLCSLTLGELSCRLLLLLLLLFPEPREYTMSLMAPMGLQDGSETSKGQVVVGCPPIGTYRSKTRATAQPRSPQYVKVNMDGVPIGRKVDLNAHESYETLAQALEDMFQWPNNVNGQSGTQTQMEKGHVGANDIKHSRLLDSSSAFALTYEDKEGDWMLVGDVPWRMFVNTVKRLRILKTSDANGLAPRCPEKMDGQKKKTV